MANKDSVKPESTTLAAALRILKDTSGEVAAAGVTTFLATAFDKGWIPAIAATASLGPSSLVVILIVVALMGGTNLLEAYKEKSDQDSLLARLRALETSERSAAQLLEQLVDCNQSTKGRLYGYEKGQIASLVRAAIAADAEELTQKLRDDLTEAVNQACTETNQTLSDIVIFLDTADARGRRTEAGVAEVRAQNTEILRIVSDLQRRQSTPVIAVPTDAEWARFSEAAAQFWEWGKEARVQLLAGQFKKVDELVEQMKAFSSRTVSSLTSVQGDRQLLDDRPDEAVPIYESALQHTPDDFRVRNNYALALQESRRGLTVDRVRQALAVYDATLTTLSPGDDRWIQTLINQGNAWKRLPGGLEPRARARALQCFRLAEAHLRESTDRHLRLSLWVNLGSTLSDTPSEEGGSATESTKYLEQALPELEVSAEDSGLAACLTNLASNISESVDGNEEPTFRRAMALWSRSLRIYSRSAKRNRAAQTLASLATAWIDRAAGDREDNLRAARCCLEVARRWVPRDSDPHQWAHATMLLGTCWVEQKRGDVSGSISLGIELLESVEEIYNRTDSPWDWAAVQANLGVGRRLQSNPQKLEPLFRAIAHYRAALQVFTREGNPRYWAGTHFNLGTALSLLAGEGLVKFDDAVNEFELCLLVFTRQACPDLWAKVQNNLGLAYEAAPGQSEEVRYRRALACFQAAQQVHTAENYPRDYAQSVKQSRRVLQKLRALRPSR